MGVDELMATCPLKHEIRVGFWEPYIIKLKRKPISYLTLYSPPLMDVKYFHKQGLIQETDGVYMNVVGVGINVEAEADTTSNLKNRLDLLLSGDINTLINGAKSKAEKVKQLEDKFPFDVINLDYTDTLHSYKRDEELSPHIEAIETILQRQAKQHKDEFVLFLTTDGSIPAYNPNFINDLKNLVTKNINETPKFSEKLLSVTNCSDVDQYFKTFEKDCFAVSIVKFILGFLDDHHYTITEGDIKWLIRDERNEAKSLLHLAFHIKKFVAPKAKKRAAVGRRKNDVESKSVDFIKKKYHILSEKVDKERLFKKHSAQINNFNQSTFELDVPEPKDE